MKFDFIKNYIENLGARWKKDNLVSDYTVNSCKSLWSTMNLSTKIKWIKFNKLYPSYGRVYRKSIELQYELDVSKWKQENPEKDFIDDCHLKLQYPSYLEPAPKDVVIVDYSIKPIYPVEYVEFKLNVDTKEKI